MRRGEKNGENGFSRAHISRYIYFRGYSYTSLSNLSFLFIINQVVFLVYLISLVYSFGVSVFTSNQLVMHSSKHLFLTPRIKEDLWKTVYGGTADIRIILGRWYSGGEYSFLHYLYLVHFLLSLGRLRSRYWFYLFRVFHFWKKNIQADPILKSTKKERACLFRYHQEPDKYTALVFLGLAVVRYS